MNFTGSHEIDLSKEKLWSSLHDVDVLGASLPGCETFERLEPEGQSYRAVILTRVGPMKARFAGQMTIEDSDPPNSYKLRGSGSAGAAGAARGEVAIKLQSIGPEKTKLDFDASIAMTGRMAQIGGKMINGTAEAYANEFFQNLSGNASASTDELTKAADFKVSFPGATSTKVKVAMVAIILALGFLVYSLIIR
jgi:hypothetical protein